MCLVEESVWQLQSHRSPTCDMGSLLEGVISRDEVSMILVLLSKLGIGCLLVTFLCYAFFMKPEFIKGKPKKVVTLKRSLTKMSADVSHALGKSGLMARYRARPPYQQNDYLSWIEKAKREETRHKRILQMMMELEKGGVYMGMKGAWMGKG